MEGIAFVLTVLFGMLIALGASAAGLQILLTLIAPKERDSDQLDGSSAS